MFARAGRQLSFTAGKVSRREADLLAAGIDRVLPRVEQGRLTLPPGADLIEFVRHDGNPPVSKSVATTDERVTLGVL